MLLMCTTLTITRQHKLRDDSYVKQPHAHSQTISPNLSISFIARASLCLTRTHVAHFKNLLDNAHTLKNPSVILCYLLKRGFCQIAPTVIVCLIHITSIFKENGGRKNILLRNFISRPVRLTFQHNQKLFGSKVHHLRLKICSEAVKGR